MRTKDAGKTWSAKQVIWDSDARTRSAPIRLTTGELVLPFYSEPPIQSLAAVSSDDGQTWRVVKIANHERFLGDEWSVVELPDGRLVGIIRNSGAGDPELNKRENRDPGHGDGVFYKTESRDRGQTWSDPQRTNLRDTASASPAQIFVHRGRPVVLYCDARMVSVSMAVSDDPELLVWNVEDRLRCFLYNRNGRTISDGGYPVSAAVGGNRRLIVDYVLGGRSMAIEGYFVEMPSTWFDGSTLFCTSCEPDASGGNCRPTFPNGRPCTRSSGDGEKPMSGNAFTTCCAGGFAAVSANGALRRRQSSTASRSAPPKEAKNEATMRERRSPVASDTWPSIRWAWCGQSSCIAHIGKIKRERAWCSRGCRQSAVVSRSCLPTVPMVGTTCPLGCELPLAGCCKPCCDRREPRDSSSCRSVGSSNARLPGSLAIVATPETMNAIRKPAKP